MQILIVGAQTQAGLHFFNGHAFFSGAVLPMIKYITIDQYSTIFLCIGMHKQIQNVGQIPCQAYEPPKQVLQ